MRIERLERLTTGIIGLAEAKGHVRVDGDDSDVEIGRMITAAIMEAEDYASMALRLQAVRVTLPEWPLAGCITLPIGPVVAPATVTVTADGDDFEDFTAEAGQRPALRLTGPRPSGRVVVEYVAGFGDDAADIPEDIRLAVLDQVAVYFDARGATDRKGVSLSPQFARIIGRYRRVKA